jgi:hypothetical protein
MLVTEKMAEDFNRKLATISYNEQPKVEVKACSTTA